MKINVNEHCDRTALVPNRDFVKDGTSLCVADMPHVRCTNTIVGMFHAPVNGAHAYEPMVSAALAEPATALGTNV